VLAAMEGVGFVGAGGGLQGETVAPWVVRLRLRGWRAWCVSGCTAAAKAGRGRAQSDAWQRGPGGGAEGEGEGGVGRKEVLRKELVVLVVLEEERF